MTSPVAVVTGAAGQDGSYLVERLVHDGYAVHAVARSADRAALLSADDVTIHEVDLTEHERLSGLILDLRPDEIYNLGGLSSVAHSWQEPIAAAEVSGVAPIVLLEAALRLQHQSGRPVRVLQASSAEIFGEPSEVPQTELTPIRPVSPYGAAKALAHHAVHVFRGRGLHASSVILYNHESPRRPTTFVTRKITAAVAAIATSGSGTLALGNLDAARDWGWAPDYVDAMVRAVRHGTAGDYVIATGTAHTVREFVAAAFGHVGVADWHEHVTIDPAFVRPADPSILVGDASKARADLGWRPSKDFRDLVCAMVDHDLALLRPR